MGITGLLPFLEKASRRCHVAEFSGCTVAIDTYCWLHKGAFGCAEKLVRGDDTNAYVLYCLKYLKMLKSYDIKPILVFDGQHLPAKQQTEGKRREQRKSARKKATELLRIGKVDEARTYMRLCIDITHKMALALITECRENGIDCIVAPYEADAQLAYLNIKKFAHFIITEDSDLLLFGCDKILYKMDVQGFGTLVEADKINLCMKLRPDNYSFDKFRYMCILSGCDYLDSLPGIGLKKALKFISMTANPSIYDVLLKLPSYLKFSNLTVTNEYRDRFMVADATFRHQLVFDPVERKLLPLNDPKAAGTKEECCKQAGIIFDNDLAFEIALGNIDPFTHEKFDDWSPDRVSLSRTSIWSGQYQKPNMLTKKVAKLIAPSTKNVQVDIQAMEQQKLEYDLKLEKELEVYKTVEHVPKKQEQESEEHQISEVSRPISVPFLNMKKISQFPRTHVNYEEPLTSSFFPPKYNSPTAESCTSNYDSLLTGISDYSKKRKSCEFKDIECTTGENTTKDLNHSELEKCRENFKRFASFDISEKVLLSKPSNEKEIISASALIVTAKSNQIENDVNISNLQEKEISETLQETIPAATNKFGKSFVTPQNLVHHNKRKETSIFHAFGIPKKKCLETNAPKKRDEQKESVFINMENIVDSRVNHDNSGCVKINDDNADLSASMDKMVKLVPQPMSPVSSSSSSYRRYQNLPKRFMTAKSQLNLRTMLANMKKC